MPDIMSVSLQDVLYCRKSDLREQKVIASQQQKNNGGRQRSNKPLPYACPPGPETARDGTCLYIK